MIAQIIPLLVLLGLFLLLRRALRPVQGDAIAIPTRQLHARTPDRNAGARRPGLRTLSLLVVVILGGVPAYSLIMRFSGIYVPDAGLLIELASGLLLPALAFFWLRPESMAPGQPKPQRPRGGILVVALLGITAVGISLMNFSFAVDPDAAQSAVVFGVALTGLAALLLLGRIALRAVEDRE